MENANEEADFLWVGTILGVREKIHFCCNKFIQKNIIMEGLDEKNAEDPLML